MAFMIMMLSYYNSVMKNSMVNPTIKHQKPRKNLEIKYLCKAKIEDGAIMVIDRERTERVVEGYPRSPLESLSSYKLPLTLEFIHSTRPY